MMNCLFYYGTEIPKIDETRKLTDTIVVLQPYHPIFVNGLYREFFPYCERYIYWNSNKIHEIEMEKLNLPWTHFDENWKTYQLNLENEEALHHKVQSAYELLSYPHLSGLFVDDLDSWSEGPHKQQVILKLFSSIQERLETPVNLFINRGFCFWHQLPNIKAILLENLTAHSVFKADANELAWIENLVKLHFKVLDLTDKNIPIYGLSYDEIPKIITEQDPKRLELFNELTKNIDHNIFYEKDLATWPASLT